MAGDVDDLPGTSPFMMLMAPLSVTVPFTKSSSTVKWLCSCSVKPVDAVGVVGDVVDVLETASTWHPRGCSVG